jgi:hypothetical protein
MNYNCNGTTSAVEVMELDAKNHMVIFLCIDYTIWPGWNHRGVYILSRKPELQASLRSQPEL